MAQKQTYKPFEVTTLPLVTSSTTADKLIPLRELLLNKVLGAAPSLVLNKSAAAGHSIPTHDVPEKLYDAVANLKGSVISADGYKVDYGSLRESEFYLYYKHELLPSLRNFDPKWLSTEDTARAFWINLYHALIFDAVLQFGIEKSVIEGLLGILSFFRRAAYLVGGQRISLEDIEQGILRGNWGHPYVPGVHFASNDPRLAWSLPLDPRIHFALNCGGRSCPPIRAYSAADLDRQLDLAARSFIDATVLVNPQDNEVQMSTIMRWYAADFGNREHLLRFLDAHLPHDQRREYLKLMNGSINFVYTPYDWQLNII